MKLHCLILIFFGFVLFVSVAEARLCSHVLTSNKSTREQLNAGLTESEKKILEKLDWGSLHFEPYFTKRPRVGNREIIQLLFKLQARSHHSRFRYHDQIRTLLETSWTGSWNSADREWLVGSYPHFDLLLNTLFKRRLDFHTAKLRFSRDVVNNEAEWNAFFDRFYFGIDIRAIEKTEGRRFARGKEDGMWWGLKYDALNTRYFVIQDIFRHPIVANARKVIDMGVGPGRFALYAGVAKPHISFVGYEYLAHRMKYTETATSNLDFQNVRLVQTDFTEEKIQIEAADVYITYYSNANYDVMESMFQKIASANKGRKYYVVAIGIPGMHVAPEVKLVKEFDFFDIYESK